MLYFQADGENLDVTLWNAVLLRDDFCLFLNEARAVSGGS